MKISIFCVLVTFIASSICCASERSRLVVLADMGNEADEEQQMLHMLMCSNEFDVEALLAVTGKYLTKFTREDLFHKLINGYEEVYENLLLHSDQYPDPGYLHSIVRLGQPRYGIADTGEGRSSPGSKLLTEVILKDDPRPVYIVVNAGSNTLAQALIDYRSNHTEVEIAAFVRKIRVFENGAQDNGGAWICSQFPDIHWMRSNHQTYGYGGPNPRDVPLDGWRLGPHAWKPYEYSVVGQHQWALKHIVGDHGKLGIYYPIRVIEQSGRLAYIEGGGTIPWMGLVNKGLFDADNPH